MTHQGASCEWCGRDFPTNAARSQHIRKSQSCTKKRLRAFQKLTRQTAYTASSRVSQPNSTDPSQHHLQNEDHLPFSSASHEENLCSLQQNIPGPHFGQPDTFLRPSTTFDSPNDTPDLLDSNAVPPSQSARVEDVQDSDESRRFIESYPMQQAAGAPFGTSRTSFESIRDDQILHGAEILGPFKNDQEWELAKWLIKNVGHNAAEEFLKLAVVSLSSLSSRIVLTRMRFLVQIKGVDDVTFTNKAELYERIDELPDGPAWKCREIVQTGDLKGTDGKPLTETLELWYRDPVECIKELVGNPMFKEHLAYAPTRVYRDHLGSVRQIDEMWTGDWWWKMQVSCFVNQRSINLIPYKLCRVDFPSVRQ